MSGAPKRMPDAMRSFREGVERVLTPRRDLVGLVRLSGEIRIKGGQAIADETFIGHKKGAPVRQGIGPKMKVLSRLDRNTGAKRSIVLDKMTPDVIADVVPEKVSREAVLMTNQAGHCSRVGKEFAGRTSVKRCVGEYVSRADVTIHMNTIEGSFGIFNRGMRGVHQHFGEQHPHRYLAEFHFRYSNRIALGVDDQARAKIALQGVVGRRVIYQSADGGKATGARA